MPFTCSCLSQDFSTCALIDVKNPPDCNQVWESVWAPSTTMHGHVCTIQPRGSHFNEGILTRPQPSGSSCASNGSPAPNSTYEGFIHQKTNKKEFPPTLPRHKAGNPRTYPLLSTWRDGTKAHRWFCSLTDISEGLTSSLKDTQTVTKFRYLLGLTDLSWQLSGILC